MSTILPLHHVILTVNRYRWIGLIFCLLAKSSQSQDINRITDTYNIACNRWLESSHKALPFFEKLYYDLQPLYNLYPTTRLQVDSSTHKMARNYAVFMYELYLKFGISTGVEKAWKLQQSLKGFDAFRLYNRALYSKRYKSPGIDSLLNSPNIFEHGELNKLEYAFEKLLPNNEMFLDVPTIRQVQKQLHPNEVYVSFLFNLNDRHYFSIKIQKNSLKILRSEGTTSELLNRVAFLKGFLKSDELLCAAAEHNLKYVGEKPNPNIRLTFKNILSYIQQQLIDPIGLEPGQKLIIENDIFISQVPFDILLNTTSKKYLVIDNEICYVPNASYFLRSRKIPNRHRFLKFLAVSGNSPTNRLIEDDFGALTNYQLDTSSKIVRNANKETFLELISDASDVDVLHISAHFATEQESLTTTQLSDNSFAFERLSRQFFIFAGEECAPSEMLRRCRLQSFLTIMSGCETATSDEIYQTLLLLRSIQKTGLTGTAVNGPCFCSSTESFSTMCMMALPLRSKYVIATQNKITQEASDQFFRQFYEYLSYYKDVALAFRKTKFEFLNRIAEEDYKFDHFSFILISD
jgi:hypothetical protein